MRADITEWEKDNQVHLRRLAGLIGRILRVMKGSCKGGRAVLKYDGSADKLMIEEVGERCMLPKDLYSKWDHGESP